MNRGKLAKLATAFSVLALTLTACGPGVDAPTRHVRQVTDGVEAEVNKAGNLIYVRNVYKYYTSYRLKLGEIQSIQP